MAQPARTWMSLFYLATCLALPLACATTTRSDQGDDDDDVVQPTDAAVGFVDASKLPTPDATPGAPDATPGAPDAAMQSMVDAGPTGPFCTANDQCNTAAHECCWLFLGNSGACVYGDAVPILNCIPSSPPDDAGP